ncbi:MAG: FliM/FliN family flagellar motor switch protein [Vicinamibacterales bacterium]
MTLRLPELLAAIGDDLTAAIGARAGAAPTAIEAAAPGEPHWVASFTTRGIPAVAGEIAMPRSAATALAALSQARPGGDVPDAAVAATLRDLFTTVLLAVNARAMTPALELAELVPEPGPRARAVVRAFEVATLTVPVVIGIDVMAGGVTAGAAAPAASAPEPAPRLDVLLDIDLPVVVRFGHTDMPLRALTKLGPGSIVDLGRSPDDPVEVLVSNRVVAHGEVVVVGGNYGVRIVDVVSPSERMRSMEG